MRGYVPSCSPKLGAISVILKWCFGLRGEALPTPTYHGDALCAAVPGGFQIARPHPAKREHRHGGKPRQRAKTFPAQRLRIRVRRRRQHRAEHREIDPKFKRAREFRSIVAGGGAPG